MHRNNTPQWWARGRVEAHKSLRCCWYHHWRSSRPAIPRCSCHRRSNTDAGHRTQFLRRCRRRIQSPKSRTRQSQEHRVRRLVSGNVGRRDSRHRLHSRAHGSRPRRSSKRFSVAWRTTEARSRSTMMLGHTLGGPRSSYLIFCEILDFLFLREFLSRDARKLETG